MPISPVEVGLSQTDREYRRLCEAIDKHILDKFQRGDALRFTIKDDTPSSAIRRAEKEYEEQGWRVLYAELLHEDCPCGGGKKYANCDKHTAQPPNTKYFVFSQPIDKKAAEGKEPSAEELLDKATDRLSKVQWHLRRESLSPPLYEAVIHGEVVSSPDPSDGTLTIQICTKGKTAAFAANLATAKLTALLRFVPEIKVAS